MRQLPKLALAYLLGGLIATPLCMADNQRRVFGNGSAENVSAPGIIVVGVRSDASPFSYKTVSRSQEPVLKGYGGYMVEICRRVLTELRSNGPFRGFEIVPFDITAGNRFEHLAENDVDMLCGPDSITLNRLRGYYASQPMFLSGLTYVSVENDKIPVTRYCKGVIGLVKLTTAESTGLQIISRNRELGRFHEPLERYLAMMADPFVGLESSGQSGSESVSKDGSNSSEITQVAQPASTVFIGAQALHWLPANSKSRSVQPAPIPVSQRGIDLPASADLQHPADRILPESVITSECKNGYQRGPVVFFDNHIKGLNALCSGEILFYMGDFDIIRKRLDGMSNCETVMRRETITKEAYGAYFRQYQGPSLSAGGNSIESNLIDSVLFSEFNNVLLQKMQAAENILDYEFYREFGNEEKTADLQRFFDGFKFASHY